MAVTVVHALLWSYRKTSCDFRVIINWKLTMPPQKEKFLFNPECHYAYSSRIKKQQSQNRLPFGLRLCFRTVRGHAGIFPVCWVLMTLPFFLFFQECFYQCSPKVYRYEDPNFKGGLKGNIQDSILIYYAWQCMIVSTYIWADILARDQDHVLCISHFRHVFKTSVIHLMYGQEGKQNSLPWDPYIMCFAIYLDFPLNNHMAKTCCCIRHAGNNCAIVSWSGYICIYQGHVTKNQPITVFILLGEGLGV